MILSRSQILAELNHNIFITPFNDKMLNSNSYNLSLSKHLIVYRDKELDMKKEYSSKNKEDLEIPNEGIVLMPNILYLGSTIERTCTTRFIPIIEGRSSIARLGLFVHITAGLGEAGFDGHWTLELTCVQPLKIYHSIPICQIYFNSVIGFVDQCRSTKYQHSIMAEPSKMYREIKEK